MHVFRTKNAPKAEFMKDKLKRLLETEEDADCTFVFPHSSGTEIIIRGHQFQLAVASSIFRAVFYQNQETEMLIEDVEPRIFMVLMEIIYLQEPVIESPVDAIMLYASARKYEVKDAVKYVREHLKASCSPKNAIILYECAKVYGDSEVEKKCVELFSDHTLEVIKSEYWVAANPEIVNKLFKMEYLSINSEQDLVAALDSFVKANSDIGVDLRRDLMGALSSLRFLTLELNEVLRTNLLTDSEKVTILKDLRGVAAATSTTLPGLSLCRTPRFNRNEFESNLRALIFCKLVNGKPRYLVNARYWNRLESEDRKRILGIVKRYQHEMLQLYSNEDILELREIFKNNDILGVHHEKKTGDKDCVTLRDSDSG